MNIALNEDWLVPFIYSYVDTNGNITGPVDLTNSLLKLEIRINEQDYEALVSVYSPDNGIQFTNATQGQFTIAIDRSHLLHLFPGTFFVDFVRLEPNGYQERIWEGQAVVVQRTTR